MCPFHPKYYIIKYVLSNLGNIMKKIKYIFFSILIVLVLSFIALITYRTLEPKAYDFMVHYVLTEKLQFDNAKNVYGHDDIVLVVIDHDSLQQYRWPWKRELISKIIDYFSEYSQSKVLIHDGILTALDDNDPESDKKYFASLKKMDNIVEGFMYGFNPYSDLAKGGQYDKMFLTKYGIKNAQYERYLPPTDIMFPSILTSPQEFLDSVKNIGSITILPGYIDGNFTDDVVRTHTYFTKYKGYLLPSLAMSGFLTINNYPEVKIDENYISFPSLEYKFKHTISDYAPVSIVPIKYYKLQGEYSHKAYSAVDIMDSFDSIKNGKKPKISPDIFKDKIVILGVNDPLKDGLNDNKSSPMRINHPAMDIQATCVDNLIHRDFLTVLPGWINIVVMIMCMILVYCAIQYNNLLIAIILTTLVITASLLLSSVCFYFDVVINTITPIIMSIVTMIIAYVHKYLIENKKKEKVTLALGKYMSEDVMKDVVKNIDNLGLGGKKAIVTVLFSDIRGFTSMSEQMSAQQVSQLLNEYFSEMEPIVSKYNGIINKFIGDAVMAVFGEPIQDENHSLNAVKCGYEMIKKVQELDKKWQMEGKPIINIGVGINTGEVFIGNIGSERRMEYTVIGDTVNLASRLESYNKTYKTQILISSSTYEAAKENIEVNQISDVEIRGKVQKMDIYEVLNIKEC